VRPAVSHSLAPQMIREAVVGVDPRVRYVSLTPATERLTPQQRSWRLGATLFSAFGLLALIVAALGLYAVLAFDTSMRTREIGVRTALGASRRAIIELVLGRALAVAAAGVALGGATAALLAPRVSELLYGVGPHDPVTYALVAGALLATAALAAVLPARRAAAVDPNEALRT
jgi:putative ABC transport system permease protein